MTNKTTRIVIDLSALGHNYNVLSQQVGNAQCAAVVKSNAYGLGIETVVRSLYHHQCRQFFVSDLGEAKSIRQQFQDVRIFIFLGFNASDAEIYQKYNFIPVLNTMEEWGEWKKSKDDHIFGKNDIAAIHVDTGMNRLGISSCDMDIERSTLESYNIELIMSHMACADDNKHPLNKKQLAEFKRIQGKYSKMKMSIANSSACYLGREYYFDLVRVGIGVFAGINNLGIGEKFKTVVHWEAKVLQLRERPANSFTVGYGATEEVAEDALIAVVGIGYWHGYSRIIAENPFSSLEFEGNRLPIIGRISMEMLTVDASCVRDSIKVGDWLEVMGESISIHELSKWAKTISYEVLTSINSSIERKYIGQ